MATREVVIVDAIRTPIGKSSWKGLEKCGPMGHLSAIELASLPIKEIVKRTKVDTHEIEDVVWGCLSQVGEQGFNLGRTALYEAGFHDEAVGCTINRYCGSGLQAINFAAQEVMSGECDLVLAGGSESMSRYQMGSDAQIAAKAGAPLNIPESVQGKGLVPMGVSADMIAQRYKISREEIEEFGFTSQKRAATAWKQGVYNSQVFPVKAKKDGQEFTITQDEGVRFSVLDNPEGFIADMKKLPFSFTADGPHTPATSSQISDAACAVMITTAEKAQKLGLKPRARFVSFGLAGSDPVLMLTGIAPAIKNALKKAGLKVDDIDIFEINEAFASPVIYAARELGIDWKTDPRINPNGGAIAHGHPIGATGAILFTKCIYELERTKKRYAVISLCMGGGMGIATIIERL
ncbi:MAG: thiolase family protein [Candidatus Calescibacterium sp.]|nr:thiolase family protein [Candidatus Calescibacterium sp.]MDW8087784.1 thiolase family protein [Candidatus Calescibacterium sp.]